MSNKYQRNLLKYALLISLIGVTVAQERRPLLGELVPNIQTDYYELLPTGNQYRLRITHPDGSQRDELVELRATGTPEEELFVQGTIDNQYADNGGRLVVIYEAGKNGYAAKVKYQGRPTLPPLPPFPTRPTVPPTSPIAPLSISASALKSSVG